MDKLNQLFDIPPFEPEPKKEEYPIQVESKESLHQDQLEDDFQLARKTMRSLLQKGESTLEEISDLARNSEHPRTYEVAGQLIKTMAEVAKDLVDLRKQITPKVKSDVPAGTVTNQQNNVFVGSTAELLKALKQEPPIDV